MFSLIQETRTQWQGEKNIVILQCDKFDFTWQTEVNIQLFATYSISTWSTKSLLLWEFDSWTVRTTKKPNIQLLCCVILGYVVLWVSCTHSFNCKLSISTQGITARVLKGDLFYCLLNKTQGRRKYGDLFSTIPHSAAPLPAFNTPLHTTGCEWHSHTWTQQWKWVSKYRRKLYLAMFLW